VTHTTKKKDKMELFQKANGSSEKSESEDSLEQQEQWTQQLHLTNVEHEARELQG